MYKKLILILIFTILFVEERIIAGDYDQAKITARNFIPVLESSLSDISYSLIDLDDSENIYSEEIYLKYFQLNEPFEYEYYSERIPEEYLATFFYFTKDKVHLRELIYAIMKHESMNFQSYSNQNKNGTTDHGPMMLNSANIKSSLFMNRYIKVKNTVEEMGYDLTTDHGKYNYYNSICIEFLSYLVRKYEKEGRSGAAWFALRAYNAGEKSNTIYGNKNRIRRGTYYANTVWSIYHKTLAELNTFKLQKERENVREKTA